MNACAQTILAASQKARRHLVRSLTTLLLLTLWSNTARATDITWTNAHGGNWSAMANWSPNLVPGPGDDVYITNYTVALDFSTGVASLTLSGGTLGGAGNLAVNGPFTWSGGTIQTTVTLSGASSLNSVATHGMNLSTGGLLINAGTLTWSGSDKNLWFNTGTLTNLALGTIIIAADISSDGGSTLGNAGLVTKTGTFGTTTLSAAFVNTGTVNVQSGTLNWLNGVSAGGTYEVSANATLQLDGVTSFNSASSETGAGMVLMSAGTLEGPGSFTVNGPFTWSGGTIQTTVTLNGASSLNSVATHGMNLSTGGLLINAGTLTWSGSDKNLWFNTGTLTNLALGTIIIAADISSDGGSTLGNAGLVTKTSSIGTSTITAFFVNASNATVQVQSGTLNLNGGGAEAGTVTNASGATLKFGGGTHAVVAGFSATGPGNLGISAGTVDFSNAAGSAVPNLALTGGTLGGAGNLAVNGPFTWSGGTIQTTVTLSGASSLNSVATHGMNLSTGGLLINAGTLTWSGSDKNLWFNTGTLTNLALGTIIIAADISSDGGSTLGNAGLVTKTSSIGTSTITAFFVNASNATVQVQSGTLNLNGGGAEAGTVTNASGATLKFGGGTHAVVAGFSATGPGNLGISAGTVDFSNAAGSAVPNLALTGGTLGGAGNLAVNGPFTWSGGTIQTTVTLSGASSLNSVATHGMNLSTGGLLINAGTLTWSGSDKNLWFNTGTLTNLALGTIIIAADISSDGGSTLGNAGLVTKTGTFGTTTLSAAFVNTGTVNVQSGTINLAGSYNLNKGTLTFGISSATNHGQINLPSGTPSFKCTLGVNLNGFYWPTAGSSFNLLNYSSKPGILFTNTTLPPFITWQTNYNTTAFTLSVSSRQTNAAPSNLTMSLAGNTNLNLVWPGDHTGWQLETQTNSLQVGLNTNWVIVSGSGLTNEMAFPISLANGAVFFRLFHP